MSEQRSVQIGDRVVIRDLHYLEHLTGEIGEVIQVIPYEDGAFIDVTIYDGAVKIRVFEPLPRLDLPSD